MSKQYACICKHLLSHQLGDFQYVNSSTKRNKGKEQSKTGRSFPRNSGSSALPRIKKKNKDSDNGDEKEG